MFGDLIGVGELTKTALENPVLLHFMSVVGDVPYPIFPRLTQLFSFFPGMLEYDPAKRFSIQQIRHHK